MADLSATTTLAAEPADLQAPAAEVPVEEIDDLVEDVSIDGMCGVY